MAGPGAGDIRALLEQAMLQHAGQGAAPGRGAPQGAPAPGPDADGKGEDQPGKGPVTRDAFGYQDKMPEGQDCASCAFFEPDESGCHLYDECNTKLPQLFSLDPKVGGGCAAHSDSDGSEGDEDQQQPDGGQMAATPAAAPPPGR